MPAASRVTPRRWSVWSPRFASLVSGFPAGGIWRIDLKLECERKSPGLGYFALQVLVGDLRDLGQFLAHLFSQRVGDRARLQVWNFKRALLWHDAPFDPVIEANRSVAGNASDFILRSEHSERLEGWPETPRMPPSFETPASCAPPHDGRRAALGGQP